MLNVGCDMLIVDSVILRRILDSVILRRMLDSVNLGRMPYNNNPEARTHSSSNLLAYLPTGVSGWANG